MVGTAAVVSPCLVTDMHGATGGHLRQSVVFEINTQNKESGSVNSSVITVNGDNYNSYGVSDKA